MNRKIIKAITIKGFKGIIVDTINWKGKKVYRVFEVFDENAESMRLYHVIYENGRYIDIDDIRGEDEEEPTIEYRDANISPRLFNLPQDRATKLRMEQIDNFLWLNDRAEEKLPIAKIIRLIKRVPIKFFRDRDSSSEDFSMRGYYDYEKGFIAFNEVEIRRNDQTSKASRFHEFIHYIQFMLRKPEEINVEIEEDIMTEAQVENIAISRLEPKRSVAISYDATRKPLLAIFNYPVDSYKYAVSILRQMETLMGRKSYDKDFSSTREFLHEFIKKYGKELYSYLTVRLTALEYERSDEILKNRGYYLSETQDKLMKEVFRQDYAKMKTIDDAKDILTRFKKLDLERVDLYVKEEDKSINPLGNYVEFYKKIYSRIGHKLLKLGYSYDEIIRELEQYKYEEQEFNPIYPEEMFIDNLRKNADTEIIKWFRSQEGINFNPDKHKIVYALHQNGDYLLGIIDRRTKKLISVKGVTATTTNFTIGEGESSFTEEDISYLKSPYATEFRLPKNMAEKNRRKNNRRNNFSDESGQR